jgi:hypothetical protein
MSDVYLAAFAILYMGLLYISFKVGGYAYLYVKHFRKAL